jgi:6-phosphofructokinase 1
MPVVDACFGFSTAIQESISFIDAANIECEAAEYCIGMVRIMGRNSGVIACNAALASRDVNVVVIPEIHFQLFGVHGLYENIISRLKQKNHMVLVVAEGAYKGLIPACREKVDELNNSKYHLPGDAHEIIDLASFIKADIGSYAATNHKIKV